MKYPVRILLLLYSMLCVLTACSSLHPNEPPSLPSKTWLQSDKNKLQQGTENSSLQFYDPEKVHTFSDLVYLALQQSPVIAQGNINLEIQEISARDAKWRYLPEMHLLYTISNNITKNNTNNQFKDSNYGKPAYQVSFTGVFNNPVATYFSVKAQNELMQVAIMTQRKAVGECIRAIADSLLLMELKERSIISLKELLRVAEKQREMATTRERTQTNIFAPSSLSEDFVQEVLLRLQEAEIELTLQRTQLKRLVGIDIAQKLKVDTRSVYSVLETFIPNHFQWQECWEQTEDRFLLHQQVRLEQANIMLAWAQYMPNISIALNENEPSGQDKPYGGKSDTFAHLTFDLPLLDWGHRYRMASMSHARKRQRQYDEVQRRNEYGQSWHNMEQQYMLARTRVEQRQNAATNAQRRTEAILIAFNNGTADMPTLTNFQQTELERRLATLWAEYEFARTRLSWMFMASELTRYFLGTAENEEK